MKNTTLKEIIEAAMELHGADGLYNPHSRFGSCGCPRTDLSPGDCLSTDCMLAKGETVKEADPDGLFEIGDIVFKPIQTA